MQSPLGNCLRNVARLLWVERCGFSARLYAAERATAGTRVTHNHNRCCRSALLSAPALSDVRASRFFAHSGQFERPHRIPESIVVLSARWGCFQPSRLRQSLLTPLGGKSNDSIVLFIFIQTCTQTLSSGVSYDGIRKLCASGHAHGTLTVHSWHTGTSRTLTDCPYDGMHDNYRYRGRNSHRGPTPTIGMNCMLTHSGYFFGLQSKGGISNSYCYTALPHHNVLNGGPREQD